MKIRECRGGVSKALDGSGNDFYSDSGVLYGLDNLESHRRFYFSVKSPNQ